MKQESLVTPLTAADTIPAELPATLPLCNSQLAQIVAYPNFNSPTHKLSEFPTYEPSPIDRTDQPLFDRTFDVADFVGTSESNLLTADNLLSTERLQRINQALQEQEQCFLNGKGVALIHAVDVQKSMHQRDLSYGLVPAHGENTSTNRLLGLYPPLSDFGLNDPLLNDQRELFRATVVIPSPVRVCLWSSEDKVILTLLRLIRTLRRRILLICLMKERKKLNLLVLVTQSARGFFFITFNSVMRWKLCLGRTTPLTVTPTPVRVPRLRT